MAAPRGVLVVEMGVRMLNRDGENTESPNGKKFEPDKFQLSRWEFAAAMGVFLVFLTGLFCIYLTRPAAAYGELRLPRTLSELRVIKDHLGTFADDYPAKFIDLGYCSMYLFMQTFMIPGNIFMFLLAGLFSVLS
ncbi:unnamed protein product [Fraxinus pennsylvanica]|uniref:Uncharacterized protein n=1 Tax=Fraxinus pennsylvanica TaxID=56036 RepID=A0AAD1ZXI5_9LAMI|nr:unnamed protein product [Fraxinus pennsylvanica]